MDLAGCYPQYLSDALAWLPAVVAIPIYVLLMIANKKRLRLNKSIIEKNQQLAQEQIFLLKEINQKLSGNIFVKPDRGQNS